jgi:Sporulation and spore germination/L,D-transpeptidase catalytic domain/Putative peptidoglycan binding domain
VLALPGTTRRLAPRRCAVWLAVAVSALTTSAAGGAATVPAQVFLLQGEGLKAAPRQLSSATVPLVVGTLLKGPTAAEAKSDVRSQIPTGTKLRSASLKKGIATIDLTRPFVGGTNRDSLVARLTQLVFTATAVKGVTGVRLWIDGKAATSMGQGVSVDRTLTRTNVDPAQPQLLPPTTVVPDTTGPSTDNGVSTTWIQQRLADLGYLPASAVTGSYGPWTRSAVLAFQGWEKLGRDGVAGPATIARLRTAKRPTPGPGTGKRIEVYLGPQVALLVDGSRVTRVIKVSTGAPGYATPSGSYAIYRKNPRDWSYPYMVWLPYASYFNGGIAFHESPDVPAYAASHGCVRIPRDDAPLVYSFATLNTPVKVIA